MNSTTSPRGAPLHPLRGTSPATRLALLAAATLTLSACISAPGYQGAPVANFDGERFNNQIPVPDKGTFDYLKMRAQETRVPWPEWIDTKPGPAPPERVDEPGRVRVTVVNHATVLIQLDGLNILTDPVWSERVGPLSWAGPRRVRPAGIDFDALPPIDVVLISHNHYDHLDLPTLERLYATDAPPRLYAGRGTRELLVEHGITPEGSDLLWWETLALPGDVRLTSVPGQHWSGRGLTDRRNTLWMGFVIEGSVGAVYFAGDTGWGPHFEQIRDRFPDIHLALLPIGAYRPEWFMSTSHISPPQAVEAHVTLGARWSVPIHYGTFPLGIEGFEDPIQDLRAALDAQRVPRSAFPVLAFGQGWTLPTPKRHAPRH